MMNSEDNGWLIVDVWFFLDNACIKCDIVVRNLKMWLLLLFCSHLTISIGRHITEVFSHIDTWQYSHTAT